MNYRPLEVGENTCEGDQLFCPGCSKEWMEQTQYFIGNRVKPGERWRRPVKETLPEGNGHFYTNQELELKARQGSLIARAYLLERDKVRQVFAILQKELPQHNLIDAFLVNPEGQDQNFTPMDLINIESRRHEKPTK